MAVTSALQICEVGAAGYRSLRNIRFPIGRLTVFVGANGVGKTNLYRALQLLQAAAAGALARELASEGGMESAFWAGKRISGRPVRIKLSVGFSKSRESESQAVFDYAVEAGLVQQYKIDVGLPPPTAAAFPLEPQI
jgi:predicted ATPase